MRKAPILFVAMGAILGIVALLYSRVPPPPPPFVGEWVSTGFWRTLSFEKGGQFWGDSTRHTVGGKWKLVNGKIVLTYPTQTVLRFTETLDYKLAQDRQRLTIRFGNGREQVFTRQK